MTDTLEIFPRGPEPTAAARLERMAASFAAAAETTEVVHKSYAIAGHTVRLRAAGNEMLQRISRAFGHLEMPGSPRADLTINLWDSATTGVSAPPLPAVGDEQAPGAFFYFSDERVRAGFQLGTSGDKRTHGIYRNPATPALSVLDVTEDAAWYWVENAEYIPYWEEATPLRFLLDWWLRPHGIHQVHAGAVGKAEGGVLIVGKSGSGKSTSTLAALQSDLLYAADDFVGVSLGERPYVHSLYSSGKLMPDHVRRLPFLLPSLANGTQLEREKAVVYVHEHWPQNIAAGFPLHAIVVPRVVPRLITSRIAEITPLQGLAALAPSTIFQLHTRGQDSLSRMSRLVERVPCFRLELGSDMASIPVAILQLLDRLDQTRP